MTTFPYRLRKSIATHLTFALRGRGKRAVLSEVSLEGVVMFLVAYTLHTHPRSQADDAGTLLAGFRPLETRAFS
ncbi:MAG: hypothetical protein L6406_10330, partial [Desulfobacterales bacterium]|nr:hypothetical protein [Desulfobacterales bacterium]